MDQKDCETYFKEIEAIKFEITIKYQTKNDIIHIKGENREQFQHYELELNVGAVEQLTNHKFDVASFYQVLKIGIETPDDKTSVTITKNGEIKISTQMTIINKTIKLDYKLQLNELELTDKQLIMCQGQRILKIEEVIKNQAKQIAELQKKVK